MVFIISILILLHELFKPAPFNKLHLTVVQTGGMIAEERDGMFSISSFFLFSFSFLHVHEIR